MLLRRLLFLTLPRYPLLHLITALDVLRLANRSLNRVFYQWQLHSLESTWAISDLGIVCESPAPAPSRLNIDLAIVCAPPSSEYVGHPLLQAYLRQLAQREMTLGAMDGGSHALAIAGLLQGYHVAAPAALHRIFLAEFAQAQLVQTAFALDRDRYTCTGLDGVQGLILELLSQQNGADLCAQVRTIVDAHRPHGASPSADPPPTPYPKKLAEALSLMQNHTQEPLSLDEIAQWIHSSRRQLERLFGQHLQQRPAKYYLALRLKRAQQLLQSSTLSISEIALSCGFASGAHFTQVYRNQFGRTPKDSRNLSEASARKPRKSRQSDRLHPKGLTPLV